MRSYFQYLGLRDDRVTQRFGKKGTLMSDIKPVVEEPHSGFPANPAKPLDLPVVDGVRDISQDKNFDPELDDEEDYS